MSHTPGPWAYEGDEIVSGDKAIAIIIDGTTDEDRANARLIAAAPDLLDALKEVRGEIENEMDDYTAYGPGFGVDPDGRFGDLIHKLDDIITKAEGAKP